ncbi:hypothetical protein V8G54_001990 [Vigna mungo]|uniref:Uncharacterized protein n=1 Tax=Vigna mungo TaxID=3915 RepID=A0AAQ3SC13_VIGMU
MVGKDKCVVFWSVHDHISTLAVEEAPTVKQNSKCGGYNAKATESPTIGPRGIYQGHTDTVEDVEKAYKGDLHCVDWSRLKFYTNWAHDAAVLCVQVAGDSTLYILIEWSPDKSSVFGNAAEDGILNIWDYEKVGKTTDSAGSKSPNAPSGLFFRHAGHRYDMEWLRTRLLTSTRGQLLVSLMIVKVGVAVAP